MARNLLVDERIFVPSSQIENAGADAAAFIPATVLELRGKSVRIDYRGGAVWVASSKCQRNIGLMILCIGDFASEAALLDPLSKSVLQFCRLLASDDYVRFIKVRSKDELSAFWAREQAAYSHVILIGHGDGSRIKFAVDEWVDAEDLRDLIDIDEATEKFFISLSCQSGYKSFGGRFSRAECCAGFIAPFHSIHGAIGSQFAQTLLAYHLLEGETVGVAFRHARGSVPGGSSFRLWRNEILTTD